MLPVETQTLIEAVNRGKILEQTDFDECGEGLSWVLDTGVRVLINHFESFHEVWLPGVCGLFFNEVDEDRLVNPDTGLELVSVEGGFRLEPANGPRVLEPVECSS